MHVVGGERRAERTAGIAGRRLDPDVAKAAVAQHLAVGDAIERDTAGKTEIVHAGLVGETRVSRRTTSSVTAWIDAAMSMCCCVSQLFGLARRAAEQRIEALVRHGEPGAVVEIVEIEPEGAVVLESIRLSRMCFAYFGSP